MSLKTTLVDILARQVEGRGTAESYAATILASVPIGLLVLRILVEERFLRRELKGYDAYTRRVRYRLIPFLW
jgi:protein-S-isoprenylcysteine O-methyltransferase Ste14